VSNSTAPYLDEDAAASNFSFSSAGRPVAVWWASFAEVMQPQPELSPASYLFQGIKIARDDRDGCPKTVENSHKSNCTIVPSFQFSDFPLLPESLFL